MWHKKFQGLEAFLSCSSSSGEGCGWLALVIPMGTPLRRLWTSLKCDARRGESHNSIPIILLRAVLHSFSVRSVIVVNVRDKDTTNKHAAAISSRVEFDSIASPTQCCDIPDNRLR